MTKLMKWRDPFNGFPVLKENLSDFFDLDSLFNEPFLPSYVLDRKMRGVVPATNIRETDNEFIVELAAPGMKKKDFVVDIDNGVLVIKVEKEEETKEEKELYTSREYNYNAFCRTFNLPETVNADKISAEYYEGILKVHLPKVPELKKKAVKEITVG